MRTILIHTLIHAAGCLIRRGLSDDDALAVSTRLIQLIRSIAADMQ